MRNVKWLAFLSGIVLIVCCFFPWVIIESKNLVISGMESTGTSFGKPGYLHLFFAGLYLLFLMFNRVWSYRANIFLAALNAGWALRNFVLIPACEGGECPKKQLAIYFILISSLALLVLSFFGGKLSSKDADIQ